jgi:hypothetical protein
MKRALLTVALFLAAAAVNAAEITLFEHDNFGGRTLPSNGNIPNLANSGFNDVASSAVVRSGTWQVCDDAYFRGRCVTLNPGRYPSLGQMGMNDRISSVRELDSWSAPPPTRPGPGPTPSPGPGWGSGVRAILFEGPNLTGRSYVVEGDVLRDLGNTGFNDRASSLRVERGYWMFCSDANFGGECRTFAPGDYPRLPQGLNNRVSSGRRISEQYPYNHDPNWSGGPR